MGLDISGRSPTASSGKCFGTNWCSWTPIHALIRELCSDLLDKDTLRALGFNDCAGPEDQEICTEMADRFEVWMEQNLHTHTLELGELQMTSESQLILTEKVVGTSGVETTTRFAVEYDHLKEWIEFLRHCGGFAVS